MADALMTPAVGGVMWGATAVATVYCAKKVREDLDESKSRSWVLPVRSSSPHR
jgi:cobalt/nickel transport system permease protein